MADGYFVKNFNQPSRNLEEVRKRVKNRDRTTLPKLKNSSIHDAAMSMADTSTEKNGLFLTEYSGAGLKMTRNVKNQEYNFDG